MAVPFIVVSRFRVKPGHAEDLRAHYTRIMKLVEENEPRVIGFLAFLNEDGSEMTNIQVHPDSASMEHHMQVLKANWDASFSKYAEYVEGIDIHYYGQVPEAALAMYVEGGPEVTVMPEKLAGFLRNPA